MATLKGRVLGCDGLAVPTSECLCGFLKEGVVVVISTKSSSGESTNEARTSVKSGGRSLQWEPSALGAVFNFGNVKMGDVVEVVVINKNKGPNVVVGSATIPVAAVPFAEAEFTLSLGYSRRLSSLWRSASNGSVTVKLAVELRNPAEGVETIWVPLSGEQKIAEHISMDHVVKINDIWEGKTLEDLNTIKDSYKKSQNASGEVPTVVSSKGDIVMESEIAAEYLDAVGQDGNRLMPEDPVQAAKVRLQMKKFNDVVAPCYQLLMNGDAATDKDKAAVIEEKLAKFVAVIDPAGPFTLGSQISLADVHAAPFLHRFKILLKHWRGYDLLAGQDRVAALLAAVEALPAFAETTLTPEQFIGIYELYANQMKIEGGKFAGRGQSSL